MWWCYGYLLHVMLFIYLATAQPTALPANPCTPSPCGFYSECHVVGTLPVCSCQPNRIGHPPNCRPECTSDTECPGNLACHNERCTDRS